MSLKLFSFHNEIPEEGECFNHYCTTCGATSVRQFLYKDLFKKLNIRDIYFRSIDSTSEENRRIILNMLYQSLNDLSEKEVLIITERDKGKFFSFTENIIIYVILEIYFILMRNKSIDSRKKREKVLEEMRERITNLEVKYLLEKMNQHYHSKGF